MRGYGDSASKRVRQLARPPLPPPPLDPAPRQSTHDARAVREPGAAPRRRPMPQAAHAPHGHATGHARTRHRGGAADGGRGPGAVRGRAAPPCTNETQRELSQLLSRAHVAGRRPIAQRHHFFCRLPPPSARAPAGSAHLSSLLAWSSTERFEVPPVASRRSMAASKSHTAMTWDREGGER
jgi:hypothetical protein